jgi:hypothetical protein
VSPILLGSHSSSPPERVPRIRDEDAFLAPGSLSFTHYESLVRTVSVRNSPGFRTDTDLSPAPNFSPNNESHNLGSCGTVFRFLSAHFKCKVFTVHFQDSGGGISVICM